MASSVMYFPDGQLVQVEPNEEYLPKELMKQEEAGGVLDFPASQSTQATRSAWRDAVVVSSVMYFPEGQLVQVGEAVEEYSPDEQVVQVLLSSSEYFPASQSTQATRSAWREAVVESSTMYFPDGQLVQLAEAAEEYFPNEQIIQDVLPCSENVPASQSRQTSSEDPGEELCFCV